MNLFYDPLVERIGWVLVHSVWLLAIPAVMFGVLLWLTPQSYCRLRYAAGVAALSIMALLPIGSLPFIDVATPIAGKTETGAPSESQEPIGPGSVGSPATALVERPRPNVAIDDAISESNGGERRLASTPNAGGAGNAMVVESDQAEAIGGVEGVVDQASGDDAKIDASVRLCDRVKPFLPWAVAVWIAGVLVMSFRLLTGWRLTRKLKRTGGQAVPDAIGWLFEELKQRIGGCKAARVVQSTLVSVPSIVGHFRPVVLLPMSAVTGLSEEQLRAILAHELAHVKRHDFLVNLCQTVVETLLYYHPAVWWVSRCVREEREHCCDSVALKHGCQASELARALVTVDAIRPAGDRDLIDSALIPAADGGSLLRRVRRLGGGTADKHVVGRSWIAGGVALLLTAVIFAATIGLTSVAQETRKQVAAEDDGEPESQAEQSNDAAAKSKSGRLDFAGGYFVELAAIRDLMESEIEVDTVASQAWNVKGNVIDAPFSGVQVRPGVAVPENEIARKFYVRARVPKNTQIDLDVAGKVVGGSDVQSSSDSDWKGVDIKASAIATLANDQNSVDLTVNLQLPAWRTLASFDFAGGVKNGIIMDWERKVSEFSRYTATGDFGSDATKDNIRVIAFDQQHQQLEAAETSSNVDDEGLTQLKVAFKISDGRPWHIVVQRRIATRPIVFRNVPLSPGKSKGVQIGIVGVVDEATSPAAQDSASIPLVTLLKAPFEPLAAELPGAGTMRLISIREAGSESPGWHADGSPRLVPFRDEQLWLLRPSTDDTHRKLEAMFEFVASSPDVRIGKIQISPEDGSGSTSLKPIEDEETDIPGVRLLQALNILDDRETEDFEVDVFAGPLKTLTTLPVGESPDDYAGKSWLGYTPESGTQNLAFLISEPKETKYGVRNVVLSILPDEAPQGSVLTGITTDGRRVDGFTNSTSGRKILGTFMVSEGQTLESIEIATQPRHSIVFRNVSVWSGLGSSAFVDNRSQPTAIDFDTVTPSRVFLLPSGERIAESGAEGTRVHPALQALDEIERRGGLFRFDAKAKAPTGNTLPYLTEIRWRDFRTDELRWVRALAGLTRLEISSEYTTDKSLRSIEHLTTLTQLELSRSRHLTTKCLKSIGKLTALRELQLVSSLRWNDEGYRAEDFKHLKGLSKIVEWEPYDWRVDDAGIAWLEDADDLELVFGWGPEVTDEGFSAFADKPDLGVIRLGPTKITDTSFKLLENHPTLYWLECSSPNLTDSAIDSAVTITRLRDLHLEGSQVTDAGVETLIGAIPTLPRLRTVNLIETQVSEKAVQRLRVAREGLRVLASQSTAGEQADKADSEEAAQPEEGEKESSSDAEVSDDAQPVDKDSTGQPSVAAAPQDVPWPEKKWTQSLPPSGSGVRVKLDDRRWVEFNSIYATQKVDGQRLKVRWKPDGELIDPPADFDPTSLVPDRDGNEMPSVTRGFVMQIVGPKGTQISLDTSGGAGYGKAEYPVEGEFVQIPLDTIASSIGYNHAYVEVKVSREVNEHISLDDSRIQVLSDPEARKVFVVTENAKDWAWRLMIKRDGKAVGVEPFVAGGNTKSWVPEALQSSLKGEFKEAQVLGFSFGKDQPMPELISLEQSLYDTVRFDNLSVYPGPRSAVVVSVNGVPVDEANRPEVVSPDRMGEDLDLARWFDVESEIESTNTQADRQSDEAEFETVTLTGTVVDANGFGIADCWVGLFIEPQEHYGQSTRSPPWAKQPLSAFADGPPLTAEAKTNVLGQFSFEAPKTHFVFEGQLWAMRPDRTLGMKWLNAVWSHVQQPENLKITIRDDEATVRVIDQNDTPIADAVVTLEAFRKPRGVTHRLPAAVQARVKTTTDESGRVTFGGMKTPALRGVQVRAEMFGTQFLSDRLASGWVDKDEALTLKLRPTASLSGQVIDFDPQLDEGLQLLAITEQHDDRPPLYGRGIATVRPDGTFRFDHLAAGRVTLESSLPPESRRKIRLPYIPSIEADEDRVLAAAQSPQMVPAVLVRQRLVKSDTGEGIPNARLSVLWGDRGNGGRFQQSQALKTDAKGWWMARVLPGAIDVRLVTVPDGYRSTAWFDGRFGRGGVTATVPATDKLVTLPPERYVPAVELTGSLQYADGSPAADWSVNGHPISWDDMGVGAVRTNGNGSFTLTYPTGYPPQLFHASNRQWMTQHDFTDRYVVPEVVSEDPLVLQIPESKPEADNPSDDDRNEVRTPD